MKGQRGLTPCDNVLPREAEGSVSEAMATVGIQRSSPHRGGSYGVRLSGVGSWLQTGSSVGSPDLVLSKPEEHPIEMKQHCDVLHRDRTSKGLNRAEPYILHKPFRGDSISNQHPTIF